MSQNGQTHFKNLTANTARFFRCSWPFWSIMHVSVHSFCTNAPVLVNVSVITLYMLQNIRKHRRKRTTMQQYRLTKWFLYMVSLSIYTRKRAIGKTFSEACWKLSNIYNGAFCKSPRKKLHFTPLCFHVTFQYLT